MHNAAQAHVHIKRIAVTEDLEQFFSESVTHLNLSEPLVPSTWTVTSLTQGDKPFPEFINKSAWRNGYIDVGYDNKGQRQYVKLEDALSLASSGGNGELKVYEEGCVNNAGKGGKGRINATIMNARYYYSSKVYTDYTIIDELSVGNHKLILSNAEVLTKKAPSRRSSNASSGAGAGAKRKISAGSRNPTARAVAAALASMTESDSSESSPNSSGVLDNVALIVNCYQNPESCTYSVQTEKIFAVKIHELDNCTAVDTFNEINTAIWDALQKGNVVIHCLAGLHRAACVVVTHFLWRHYKMGQKNVPSQVAKIYRLLSQRRRGVAQLDYGPLVKLYQDHLLSGS